MDIFAVKGQDVKQINAVKSQYNEISPVAYETKDPTEISSVSVETQTTDNVSDDENCDSTKTTNHFVPNKDPMMTNPLTKAALNFNKMITSGKFMKACTICGKVFTCASMLSTHKVVHQVNRYDVTKRKWICWCLKTFSDEKPLLMHQTEHMKLRRKWCSKCCKCFKSKEELKKHEREHVPKSFMTFTKSWKCSCGVTFKDQNSLQVHRKEHFINQKWHYCPTCNAFNSRDHEEEHELVKPPINSDTVVITTERTCLDLKEAVPDDEIEKEVEYKNHLICTKCGRPIPEKLMSRHQKKIPCNEQLSCELCGFSFKNKVKMMRHIKIHRIHSYKCPFCTKAFIYRRMLAQHLCIHAAEVDKAGRLHKYACPLCNFVTGAKNLLSHSRGHVLRDMKPLKKQHDSYHELYMKGKSPEVITIGKIVSEKKQKQKAVQKKVSHGECICVGNVCKCHQCRLCGENFIFSDLLAHLQMHLGKFIQCMFCEKMFSKNLSFFKHQCEKQEMPSNGTKH